jgi:hypothetical protein
MKHPRDFRSIKNATLGAEPPRIAEPPTDGGVLRVRLAYGDHVPQSSRRMERDERGQPIYSNTPGRPRHESFPAFSGPIAPGPNERHGGRGPIES